MLNVDRFSCALLRRQETTSIDRELHRVHNVTWSEDGDLCVAQCGRLMQVFSLAWALRRPFVPACNLLFDFVPGSVLWQPRSLSTVAVVGPSTFSLGLIDLERSNGQISVRLADEPPFSAAGCGVWASSSVLMVSAVDSLRVFDVRARRQVQQARGPLRHSPTIAVSLDIVEHVLLAGHQDGTLAVSDTRMLSAGGGAALAGPVRMRAENGASLEWARISHKGRGTVACVMSDTSVGCWSLFGRQGASTERALATRKSGIGVDTEDWPDWQPYTLSGSVAPFGVVGAQSDPLICVGNRYANALDWIDPTRLLTATLDTGAPVAGPRTNQPKPLSTALQQHIAPRTAFFTDTTGQHHNVSSMMSVPISVPRTNQAHPATLASSIVASTPLPGRAIAVASHPTRDVVAAHLDTNETILIRF